MRLFYRHRSTGMFKNFAKAFANMLYKLSNNSVMSAVRKGLIFMMPLFLIGAFTSLLLNLPIPVYQNFMYNPYGRHWRAFLSAVNQGTFGIVSLGTLLSVSYFLVKEKKQAYRKYTDNNSKKHICLAEKIK